VPVTIAPFDLRNLVLAPISDEVYDGNAHTPTPVIQSGGINFLPTDTVHSYANNIDAGTATVAIRAGTSGNSTNFAQQSFAILPIAIVQNDVETASSIIESMADIILPQATANTDEEIRAWLAEQINALPGFSETGVTVTAADITLNNFQAALTGSADNLQGTDGSFTFTVSLHKTGAVTTATTPKNGTITATVMVNAETPDITVHPQSAVYAQNDPAIALSITASVSDGGTLSYQWYRNFGTAISGATGSSYVPPTSKTGTNMYYVMVTNTNTAVNGSQTTTATSFQATVTVTAPTAVETPENDKALRAYIRDGVLHVGGLTAGKTWSVYSLYGARIYQNTANGSEASVAISAHGVYFVKSENETLKVVY
jgi:hypothetical protein